MCVETMLPSLDMVWDGLMFMYATLLCTWYIFTFLCTRYAFFKLNPYASYIYAFWLIKYSVSSSLSTCCACVYKCKIMLCTHLGGATQFYVVSFLQIFVLSSNTKKGEIERAHFILLWFCVLVNNTRIHFTWISKCCRNYPLHRNIGKTKLRPESPPIRAGVSAPP